MFRFYITDLFEGRVIGTNDMGEAYNLSRCEDYFVVDTETGKWITHGEEAEVAPLENS